MKTATQCKTVNTVAWVLQILLAGVMTVTGTFPKLTGDPHAIALFEKLGFAEGRFVVGAAEAIAVVLLLTPRVYAIGGLLVVALMLGAIASHLGPLGINTELVINGVPSTNPPLFPLAVACFLCSAFLVWLRRNELPIVGPKLKPTEACSVA